MLGALGLLWPAPAAATVMIDLAPVGNPGNANDPTTGNLYGGVDYAYSIGKYEVTVGQYTEFLNAVAATDTYGLYNTSMATDLNIAGISRSGSSGSYTYSEIGSANHPVTYVSWGDAARFCNWLQNGQPTGAQDLITTEDGSYFLNGATSNVALNAVVRKSGATWVIPTENEWYKAAYHQPAAQGGDSDNYWLSPTSTNSVPNSDQPPGDPGIQTNAANFYRDDGLANGYNDGYAVTGPTSYSSTQNYLTDVGAYIYSPSSYGTFDQGGNVWEWNELFFVSSYRGLRGGSWGIGFSNYLQASYRIYGDPPSGNNVSGFRVAAIPEPSTAVPALAGCVALLALRRRELL